MRRATVFLVIASGLIGCTTTYQLQRPPTGPELQMLAEEGIPMGNLPRVRGYEIKRRGRGALEGLGFGVLGGFMAGALIGASQAGDNDTACVDHCGPMFSSGDIAIFGGVLGAAAGGVIGLITGAIVGHKDRYLF